jgi:hypothetical protein
MYLYLLPWHAISPTHNSGDLMTLHDLSVSEAEGTVGGAITRDDARLEDLGYARVTLEFIADSAGTARSSSEPSRGSRPLV